MTGPTPATALLLAWRAGDESALDKLIPLVHTELRQIAGRMMARERQGHTLQPTALANEVFLRLSTCAGCSGRTAHIFWRWRHG